MNQTERVTSRGPADATQEPVPESILRAESCFQQNDFNESWNFFAFWKGYIFIAGK